MNERPYGDYRDAVYLTEQEFCDLLTRAFVSRVGAERHLKCHPQDIAANFVAYADAAADGMGVLIQRLAATRLGSK